MEFPDIKTEVLELYKKEFLRINNLKLGDEIETEFSYTSLHPKYKSRQMERFTEYKIGKGILKENSDGLFVESNENFNFHFLTSNNLTGRSRRENYKTIHKKSIYKIRGGLTF